MLPAVIDPQYDVFISYASEDYATALAWRERLGDLAVFLDRLEDRPPSTVLGIVRANLRLLRRRLRAAVTPEQATKTDDEIRAWLRSKIDRSRSVMVMWSRSHRGSYWANEEIGYFEESYPARPIFCQRVDPIEAPDTWTFLDNPEDLTRERIQGSGSGPPVEPKGEQGDRFENTQPDARSCF